MALSLPQIWEANSGVPLLLNTSFNDREPICETPADTIRCFLATDIDYLYFPEHGLVVTKRSGVSSLPLEERS